MSEQVALHEALHGHQLAIAERRVLQRALS